MEIKDIHKFADLIHESLGLSNETMVDPVMVASEIGFNVLGVDFDKSEEDVMGMVFSDSNQKAILISNDAEYLDKRFIAAHEIGHVVIHHAVDDGSAEYLQVDYYRASHEASDPKERDANIFAAALLIPEESAIKAWEQLKDVDDFADEFTVNKRTASIRLMNLELI